MFILAKAVLITLTAFFIGPFHGFSIKLFREGVRYRKISSAYAIGKCLATLILACSFYIFELTHSLVSVGLILTIAAIIMSGALYYADAKKYKLFEGTQILPSNWYSKSGWSYNGSAAICAYMAKGYNLADSCEKAKLYLFRVYEDLSG